MTPSEHLKKILKVEIDGKGIDRLAERIGMAAAHVLWDRARLHRQAAKSMESWEAQYWEAVKQIEGETA